jgi:hypothetical protein
MKKWFLFFAFIAFASTQIQAQDNGLQDKKGQSQDDLDKLNSDATEQQLTTEQKKYEEQKRKELDKKKKIQEKNYIKSQKANEKRLNQSKTATRNKKKNYVKTHGGKGR